MLECREDIPCPISDNTVAADDSQHSGNEVLLLKVSHPIWRYISHSNVYITEHISHRDHQCMHTIGLRKHHSGYGPNQLVTPSLTGRAHTQNYLYLVVVCYNQLSTDFTHYIGTVVLRYSYHPAFFGGFCCVSDTMSHEFIQHCRTSHIIDEFYRSTVNF